MKKLNLGCGNYLFDGYENHDIRKHRPEIKYSFDLNNIPYPFKDNEWDEIMMFDVLEHLKEPLDVMNELHRILKPNGLLSLRVAYWENIACWDDITHRKVYGENAFDCLDPSTPKGKEYGYYSDRKWKIEQRVIDRSKSLRIKMRKIK